MKIIGSYCSENELVLNFKKGKTESMLFGTAKRLSQNGRELKIYYNGTIISFVKEYAYLAPDSTLTLNTDFDRAYNRASSRMRLLQMQPQRSIP